MTRRSYLNTPISGGPGKRRNQDLPGLSARYRPRRNPPQAMSPHATIRDLCDGKRARFGRDPPINPDILKIDPLIPVRRLKRKRVHGYDRKMLSKEFDDIRYRRRNLVESVFSVIKRKYGEDLRARKYWSPVKEIKVRVVICNIERWLKKKYVYRDSRDSTKGHGAKVYMILNPLLELS